MKSIELNTLIQTLGWVLLHSVWQGLLVYLLFLTIRKMLPGSSSTARYLVGIGSLTSILILSAMTYYYLWPEDPGQNPIANFHLTVPYSWELATPTLWVSVIGWINLHLQDIVLLWMTGILLFGFRLMVAGWHATRLQRNREPIDGFWESRLQELASTMGIHQIISLAQSHSIDSPILLGYLKPVILLPVGILSGLSADQVEAILLHELAHIKRCDYAINLGQSIMEVVFFFNPFVWAISSSVRVEREKCCDDAVIKLINPLAYVQALYQLEATRIPETSLALAAGGKQNQLLHRIKRIMEPKEKRAGGAKAIPAVVVITLLLASALFIRAAYLPERSKDLVVGKLKSEVLLSSDTTIKEKKPAIRFDNQKKKEGFDAQVGPVWDQEDDQDLVVVPDMPVFGFEAPVAVLAPIDVAPFEGLAPMAEIAELAELARDPLAEVNFNLDALDTLPEIREYNNGDRSWEEFEKEFTQKFREKFSDFYKKNQPEFEKMMKDLEANMEQVRSNGSHWSRDAQRDANRALAHAQREMTRFYVPNQRDLMRQQEQAKRMEMDMARSNLKLATKMNELERHHKSLEARMKNFESELTDQLTLDGYLNKNDKLSNMNWEGDNITVNGKKIKEKDIQKYRELHQKYFRERGRFRHEE